MYAVFLRDYFTVFPRQQIFIQRLEDRKDMKGAMREIFTFLEMGKHQENMSLQKSIGIFNFYS